MGFFSRFFKFDPEIDYQIALREDTKGNYAKAYWLFEKAAKNGMAKAKFQCGYMCVKGRGTKKNPEKGFNYVYEAATEQQHKAQYFLAQMYKHGIGVEKDQTEADNWLKKATATGDITRYSFLDLWEE
jgi:uncharacterized protein